MRQFPPLSPCLATNWARRRGDKAAKAVAHFAEGYTALSRAYGIVSIIGTAGGAQLEAISDMRTRGLLRSLRSLATTG